MAFPYYGDWRQDMDAREQSDQVALAVDKHPGSATNLKELGMYYSRIGNPNPFDNVVFMKNAIASGSIVPPRGEADAVRRIDFIIGYTVLILIGMGAIFLVTALIRW